MAVYHPSTQLGLQLGAAIPTAARAGAGWSGLDGVFLGASPGSLCPISSSCWDHSEDKSNFPTSSSRGKLSLADLGGAGKVENPLRAAETPVPQSTVRCSPTVSPGYVIWGSSASLWGGEWELLG